MRMKISDLIMLGGIDMGDVVVDIPTDTIKKVTMKRDLEAALDKLDGVVGNVNVLGYESKGEDTDKMSYINSEILGIMELLQGVSDNINNGNKEPRIKAEDIKSSVNTINENISDINKIFDQLHPVLMNNELDSELINSLNRIEDTVNKINSNVDKIKECVLNDTDIESRGGLIYVGPCSEQKSKKENEGYMTGKLMYVGPRVELEPEKKAEGYMTKKLRQQRNDSRKKVVIKKEIL